jgi:hypothetical protein
VRTRPGRRRGARPADVAHLEPLAFTWLVGTPVVRSSGALAFAAVGLKLTGIAG